MSFEVRATYEYDPDEKPFDEGGKDDQVIVAAGRQSDFSGAGACRDLCGGREHGWKVPTFEEAHAMKQRLDKVPGLIVNFREDVDWNSPSIEV